MCAVFYDVDISSGGRCKAAIGCSNRCIQCYIPHSGRYQISPGSGNCLIYGHVPNRCQSQCRCGHRPRYFGPAHRRVDVDVTAPDSSGVCRVDSYVCTGGQSGRDVGDIHVGRGRGGIRRENAAGKCLAGRRRTRDSHVSRVEQPEAPLAVRRSGIDVDACHVQPVPGGFDQTAVAPLGAAARRDAAVRARRVICPQHDPAAAAGGDGVSGDSRVSAHVRCRSVLNFHILSLVVAADKGRTAAGIAGDIDAAIEQADVPAADRDAAAGLPRTGAGRIQSAPHAHRAVLHIAQQLDRTVVILDTQRLNHAGVVYSALHQVLRRLGGQQHLSTVGPDQTAILNKRVHCALVHADIEQSVSGHVKSDGITRGESHRAEFCRDHAAVADVGAQQSDIATIGRGVDRTLVEDRAITRSEKQVSARHEISVRNIQG